MYILVNDAVVVVEGATRCFNASVFMRIEYNFGRVDVMSAFVMLCVHTTKSTPVKKMVCASVKKF